VRGIWVDGFFCAVHGQVYFSASLTIALVDKFRFCGLASMDFRATATIWPTFAFDGEQVVTPDSAS
jgi:hypothetical protein